MPDIRSILAERHVTVSSATPSHSDVVVGSLWVDSDDSKFYICTSVGPIVFTEYSFVTDNYVTNARLADMAVDTVKGRVTAGTGDPEDVATTGSGNVVRATSPTLVTPALGTPASGVLTNVTGLPTTGMVDDAVTNVKLANMAVDTVKGRATAGTGDPEDIAMTAAARSVLDDTTVAAMVDTLGGAAATGSGGLVRATSPALTTPTGIVKGDVGLGNVDNTSNTTERAATATLSNKTIATPLVTGIITEQTNHKRFTLSKGGITDNTAATFATITTITGERGVYVVFVQGICFRVAGANTASKAFSAAFCRSMGESSAGVNSAVSEIVETASAAMIAAEVDIASITMTVVETSELIQSLQITIDSTGTSGQGDVNFQVTAEIQLVWGEFSTAPLIAAV